MTIRVHAAAPSQLRMFLDTRPLPGLPADPHFLLSLARDEGSVFDVHDRAGRALVAVLTDLCENSGQACELMLLACREMAPGEELIEACVRAALAAASRGPHAHLEIALVPLLRPFRDLLTARGFAPRYEMITMAQRHSPHAVSAPARWDWRDLGAEDLSAFRGLSRAAFQGHPGVNYPPEGHNEARYLRRTPPVRLLHENAVLIGSVAVHIEQDGTGMIETILRHPDHARRGAGPVLLTEALRLLRAAGCQNIRLDASVENRRALRLYQNFGFEEVDATTVLGVAL